MRLQCFDIDGVQTGQSFLHVVEFFFILSLPLVYFFSQEADLAVEFFAFSSVVLQCPSQFFLQVGNFCVFDFDQFSESVEFSGEAGVLLAHVLPEVAELIVEQLFELDPQLLYLPVLFLHHAQEVLPVLRHHSLQALDLSLLLPPAPLLLLEAGGVAG